MNRYTNESLRTPHRNFSLFTRLFVSFTVLIAFQCAYAQQADQEVLDNAAVVKLVQAHLGTDLIIEQIRNSPSNFTLTTASLIKLKQQGVPDKVIAAMQAAKGASAKSPAGAGSASAASVSTRMVEANRPDQIAGVPSWQLKTVKDAMTDKVSSELELQAVGDPVGRLRATASCRAGNIGGGIELRGVNLYLQVLTRGLEFERSPNPTAASRCANFGLRLSAEQTVHSMRPGYCDKDGVSLFIEEDLSKVADRMGLKHVTDSVALSSLKFVDAYDRNVIPANDLFRSDFMRINLDFANGQSTIVTLPLKDPEFKKFVDKCMPAPAPPEKPCPPRPVPWQAPAQITYEGTADGFAAALPGFLNRAIGANRFPAQPVDSQVATIVEQVKNCASITPQMVEAATARCGIDFTKMADHYKRCDDLIFLPSFKAPRPDRPNFTRDPYLRIFPRGTWGDGSGLTVMIQSQTFYIRAHIEQSSPSATGQTAPVAQQPVLPIQNPDLPSTAEVWKGFTMAYTKRLVRDPNPQAPANCTIPANSEVEVKAGGPDSSGRITVSTIGQPAYKAAPCSYLFYTTSDNLRK